jgi:serine/threonine protein kinase
VSELRELHGLLLKHTPAASDATDKPVYPSRVGRFALVEPLAAGGMARLFLASDAQPSQPNESLPPAWVLKFVHPHLSSWRTERDLLDEAQMTLGFVHPNVVSSVECGEVDGSAFLVMPFVPGAALDRLVELGHTGEPIRCGLLLRSLVDALRGLHALHDRSDEAGPLAVVHRDVSPPNVLVGTDGVARICDFGLALSRLRRSTGEPGAVQGKFGYLAPEQVQCLPLDRRADVFSAGVIAWELIAGRRLHRPGNHASTLVEVVERDAPLLSTIVDCPRELERAVHAALTRNRDQRTGTAKEFAEALLETARGSAFEIGGQEELASAVRRVAPSH